MEKEALKSRIYELAEACEFSHFGPLNVAAMQLHPEVRDMCASGKCMMYGKNWCCPPHCGTLEELEQKVRQFSDGIIVQSTGELEDDFDAEVMMETEQIHKQRFSKLVEEIWKTEKNILPLSAGTCTRCKTCTCPDEPCRFPDTTYSSMEATGLNVSEVCTQSNIPYYYGKLTITYTSCILF